MRTLLGWYGDQRGRYPSAHFALDWFFPFSENNKLTVTPRDLKIYNTGVYFTLCVERGGHFSVIHSALRSHVTTSNQKSSREEILCVMFIFEWECERANNAVFPVYVLRPAAAPRTSEGAAKDWLKGGSQGKNGPEGPKARSVTGEEREREEKPRQRRGQK